MNIPERDIIDLRDYCNGAYKAMHPPERALEAVAAVLNEILEEDKKNWGPKLADTEFDPKFTVGRDHPETSKKANRANFVKRGTQIWEVLNIHWLHQDGLTDDALEAQLPGKFRDDRHGRTRRKELSDRGWIEDTGEEALTRKGQKAKVWRITRKGLAEFHPDKDEIKL